MLARMIIGTFLILLLTPAMAHAKALEEQKFLIAPEDTYLTNKHGEAFITKEMESVGVMVTVRAYFQSVLELQRFRKQGPVTVTLDDLAIMAADENGRPVVDTRPLSEILSHPRHSMCGFRFAQGVKTAKGSNVAFSFEVLPIFGADGSGVHVSPAGAPGTGKQRDNGNDCSMFHCGEEDSCKVCINCTTTSGNCAFSQSCTMADGVCRQEYLAKVPLCICRDN